MNKLFLTTLTSTVLFASTQIYTYTPMIDYKEYVNSNVIDKDYSNFGDLVGVGIYYISNTRPAKFTIRFEYAGGESTYEGATWAGTPISNTQKNVHILNLEGAVGIKYFYLTLGYREWNRGKSEYVGDYDEKYYWNYFGIRYDYTFLFNKNIAFTPQISYQLAISPKLKVYLGNSPTLNLGPTHGSYIHLPLYFHTKKLTWFVFYRYQYWHISRSNYEVLQTQNSRELIYEPESITRNQYVGLGILISF